ncbi:LOW QUALITY PROTEIN: uncharacterized protein LOC108050930 [Drosophila rhopaloa]|uniref:Uncharacterized protein n=1 Tax=Drosophila rhopaloa TaxID=1041015 RepID=A0ABM5I0U5_DRORH|nr:LOW QUALITY PROTEIN: uncharacterized protein LOC108050930 [Drosophila rhopaloa]
MRRTQHSVIHSLGKYSAQSFGDSHLTKKNYLEIGEGEDNTGNKFLGAVTVRDILNDVLFKENFQLKQSDSSLDNLCQPVLSTALKSKSVTSRDLDQDLDMDPRLRNWNRVLKQRRRLQERIERQTGKRAEDVLFNRSATIDEASKRMILRVLDSADRTRPLVQLKENATLTSLKPCCDPELCRDIHELYAAKPLLQPMEFVGLPQVTQVELAATELTPDAAESQWQRSKVLGQRLEAKKKFIKQVLEFAPDLQELQVTPAVAVPPTNLPPIIKVDESELQQLSGDSTVEEEDSEADLLPFDVEGEDEWEMEPEKLIREDGVGQVEIQDLDEPQDKNGLMINGVFLDYGNLSGATGRGINVLLTCDPYERTVKVLLDIQNLSPKLVHVFWLSRCRLRSDRLQLNAELVFDRSEFILEPQGRRVVKVMFQPQKVGLFTQRWSVCLAKSPFCGTKRLDVIVQGQCTMPAPFKRRLEGHRQVPLDKQQRLQANSIIKMQASLAPIIENPPLLCPYQRILDEREVFNAQNFSYRCDRYEDLEALKDIYAAAKKPRDRPWDLSIESMRRMIGQQESRKMREKLHNRLVDLLQPMKCNRCATFPLLEHNPERDRARFIYVRGTITSTIDEWEVMALGLDEQFFKLELLRYLANHPSLQELGLTQKNRQQESTEPSEEMEIVEYISKRVKSNKYLKDSLYMHTYDLLCDAAEDIVSVIESTAD